MYKKYTDRKRSLSNYQSMGMKRQQVIRAGAIELVDAKGRVRMVLAVEGGPAVILYDRKGSPSATLYLGANDEPTLTLTSKNAKALPQVRLQQGETRSILAAGALGLQDRTQLLYFEPPRVREEFSRPL